MKKILALTLVLITVFMLGGCNKYKPVKSTKEESRVVMTVNIGGDEYDVRYELYRALFLNYKESVDGGDGSVWSGDDAQKYVDEINEIIIYHVAEIYSVFSFAKELGIDPFSKEIDGEIESRIETSVESVEALGGFDGDYDAYLSSLKAGNLNYSVQVLMLRYRIMLEKINEYYVGTEDEVLGALPGDFEFTKEDVKNFYESDECARFLHAFVGKNKMKDAKGHADALRDKILNTDSEINIALLIINNTTAVESDLIVGKKLSGITLGKASISDGIYETYRDAAFSLDAGELSEVIEVGGSEPGYCLIYALEKNDEHFERCYESVKNAYLDNAIGKKLATLANSAVSGAEFTKEYDNVVHGGISMD